MVSPSRRLAVVASTAGSGVGGAEMVLRRVGEGLAGRGWEVDLLTSCAQSIYTWENVLPAGVSSEGALTVRRFPAVGLTQPERDRLGARVLAGERLDTAEQYRWANSGMRMPGLYEYLADHAGDYRAIVCGPYLFWMCLVLADLEPERTICMPCLHDEPFASLEVYRYQLTSVRGLWMLSEPEHELARRLGVTGARVEVVGSAVDPPLRFDTASFRSRHGIDEDFILFAGRREWGKGWPQLLDDLSFTSTVLAEAPPLVTCGVGDVGRVPPGVRVRDLGMISDEDRTAAQAAAAAYIQPSAMESFSRTVLEAMQLGTPVIANDASAVVRSHLERSGAGVTYRNRYELAECLRLLHSDPDLVADIGAAGPGYVGEHFGWDAVLDRAEASIEAWL